jgi:hypothetical protein
MPRGFCVMTWTRGSSAAQARRIADVSSVEPSSTATTSMFWKLCA